MANLILIIFALALLFLIGLLYFFAVTRKKQSKHLKLDKARRVKISDHEINYYQKGKGKDLLLLHGLGSSAFCWEDIYDELAKQYRVTAIDLPGFGLSDKKPELGYSYKEQIKRLKEFCDQLNISKNHLLGCSMGGTLSLGLAIDHPELVESVAVISPAIQPRLAWRAPKRAYWVVKLLGSRLAHPFVIDKMAKNVFVNQKKVQPEYLQHYYSAYIDSPDAVLSFWRAIDTIRDFPYSKSLGLIHCPVLLLYGEKDRVTPWSSLKTMQKQIPQLVCYRNADGGHHLMEDEPDFVIEKLQKFFGTT